MKKKIRHKILFLVVVMLSSHLYLTPANADEKLDKIKNISDQIPDQDTNASKDIEKNIEKGSDKKETTKTYEQEPDNDNIDDETDDDEEENEPKKPQKEKVTLVENYKEEYKTYEEIMGEGHFFYSSVGNGEWTDKKVHIEFPAKMKVKIKKDGADYKYVKGKDFTKKGTYFFTLEVNESKDKILTANFHFRIQLKPKKTPEELKAEEELKNKEELSKIEEYEKRIADIARDLSGSKIDGSSIPKIDDLIKDGNGTENSAADKNEEAKSEDVHESDFTDLPDESKKDDTKKEPDGKKSDETVKEPDEIKDNELKKELDEIKKEKPDTEIMDEKGEIKEDEIKKLIGKLDEEEKQAAEKEEVTFDTGTGLFKNALKSGDIFLTNVANGSITNQSVMIAKSDTLNFKLFKDGKLVEDFNPGSYVEGAGSYALYPESEALSFKVAYKEIKPVFTFRIIESTPVRDLGILPLAPGTKLIDVQINGKSYPDAVLGKSGQMLKLWKDGNYKITTSDKSGEHTLDVTLDRVSPRFQVNLLDNQAQITYLSNDISRFELYKDNTLEKEGEIVEIIEGPGTYRLVVTDNAGNKSEASFNIKYQINQAALIAIAIVIALVIAGIFFFKRMNKTVTVR